MKCPHCKKEIDDTLMGNPRKKEIRKSMRVLHEEVLSIIKKKYGGERKANNDKIRRLRKVEK